MNTASQFKKKKKAKQIELLINNVLLKIKKNQWTDFNSRLDQVNVD